MLFLRILPLQRQQEYPKALLKRAVKQLSELGYIEITYRKSKTKQENISNLYKILIENIVTLPNVNLNLPSIKMARELKDLNKALTKKLSDNEKIGLVEDSKYIKGIFIGEETICTNTDYAFESEETVKVSVENTPDETKRRHKRSITKPTLNNSPCVFIPFSKILKILEGIRNRGIYSLATWFNPKDPDKALGQINFTKNILIEIVAIAFCMAFGALVSGRNIFKREPSSSDEESMFYKDKEEMADVGYRTPQVVGAAAGTMAKSGYETMETPGSSFCNQCGTKVEVEQTDEIKTPQMMTAKEVVEIFFQGKVGVGIIYQLCREKKIPHNRMGFGKSGIILFDVKELNKWWDEQLELSKTPLTGLRKIK